MKYFIAAFFISLSASFFYPNSVFGQQRIRFKAFEVRSSGIQFKGDFFQLKDRLISPLAYSGAGGQIDYFWSMEGEVARNYFNIGLNLDFGRNRFSLDAIYFQPEIIVSHTRITDMAYSDKQQILMGFAVSAKPRLYKFIHEDADHLYWMNSYTLDFHWILEQEIGKTTKLWVELQVPLVGVVFRPEQEIFNSVQLTSLWEIIKSSHSGVNFASLHNFQSATLRAYYDLAADERGALSVGYEADFVTFSRPVRAYVLTHSLTLRFMFNRLVL